MTAKTADDGDREPAGRPGESGTGWPASDDDESPTMHAYQPSGASTPPDGPGLATAQLPARAASQNHDTVALPARRVADDDRPRDDEPSLGVRVARRWWWYPFAAIARKAFWLAAIAGIIVILLLVTTMFGLWPKIGNPFSSQKTDRSGPVLLVSIQDLARFEAASGNFQVIVDLQENRKYIPSFLYNQRSLFVAAGSVDAYVDFSKIGNGAVKVDPTDAKKVTVSLPAPQLEAASIDVSRSYLYATQQGLINRLGDIFSNNGNDEQQLYVLGQQKIQAAAQDSQLLQRAQDNTKNMLIGLLRSLGYTTIVVNFPSS